MSASPPLAILGSSDRHLWPLPQIQRTIEPRILVDMAASLPTPPLSLPLLGAPKVASGRRRMAIPASAGRTSGEREGDIVEEALMAAAVEEKKPWWAPLFLTQKGVVRDDRAGSEGQGGRKRAGLTAEKARLLRKELRATECWHDIMYHSAIATRLASPDEKR